MTLDDAIAQVVRAAVRDEVERAVAPLHEELRLLREAGGGEPAVPQFVDADRAGEIAGVTADTIRHWVKEGRLTSFRAGRLLRIRVDELVRYLGRGDQEAATNVIDLESRAREILER